MAGDPPNSNCPYHLWKTWFLTGDGEAISEMSPAQTTAKVETSSSEPRWFAAYTASHHERHVAEQLELRKVEFFLSVYSESRHWNKRKPVDLNLPLFPNYVFVRSARGQRVTALSTPRVFSIVGSSQTAYYPTHPFVHLGG
jgi:hypothetical protein